MSTAFISYRRASAAGEARALFNDLVAQLGKRSVFMDVDSIALGRDFRSALEETLARCDLMLVLIDRNWLDAKDERGQARLENPSDYVRLEIETALRRNIIVTPVLVQGAHVPAPEQLPPEIRDLAYRYGFVLDHGQWESDVHELVRRLGLTSSKRGRGVFLDWISNKRRISLAITLVVLLTGLMSIFILGPALRPQPDHNRQGYEHPDEKSGLEPNLSIATAKSITEGKTVSGSLVPGQDRHFFQFQASSTKTRVILRKRFQGAVDVYDHNENLVARETEGVALVGPGQDLPITLSFESHPGELYYIAVTALGSKTSSDYELTVRKE
jgi:hypothetical protein